MLDVGGGRNGSVAISAGWYRQPMKFDRLKMTEALRRAVQRMHYPLEVMLMCVRWYAGYLLSFRQIGEMKNTAAIMNLQADSGLPIEIRQLKYLNNILEQNQNASLGRCSDSTAFAAPES